MNHEYVDEGVETARCPWTCPLAARTITLSPASMNSLGSTAKSDQYSGMGELPGLVAPLTGVPALGNLVRGHHSTSSAKSRRGLEVAPAEGLVAGLQVSRLLGSCIFLACDVLVARRYRYPGGR